jgi:hypothetical protein
MYLVDTNIWLERLLDQAKSEEVRQFLDSTPSETLFLTDFTFHSIGVIMMRLNRQDQFLGMVQDLLVDGGVGVVRLLANDMRRLVQVAEQFGLDFDDAYQYVAAETHDLTLISFDGDFDRAARGRREPGDVLPGRQ